MNNTVKPILFNSDMVTAILNGNKTVTRKVIKPKYKGKLYPIWEYPDRLIFADGANRKPGDWWQIWIDKIGEPYTCTKPSYEVGDVLYVKETWQYVHETEYDFEMGEENNYCRNIRTIIENWGDIPKTLINENCTMYSCELMEPRPQYVVYKESGIKYVNEKYAKLNWQPSTRMPIEAARIFLKVTDIQADRLNNITDDDAEKEGCFGIFTDFGYGNEPPLAQFIGLWDRNIKSNEIHKYGWSANPWVWVIGFERCDKPKVGGII